MICTPLSQIHLPKQSFLESNVSFESPKSVSVSIHTLFFRVPGKADIKKL